MSAFYCFLRSTQGSARWQVATVGSVLLGTLSKEVIVTTPALIALFDRLFVGGSWAQLWRQRTYLYTGLAASLAVSAGLLWSVPHGDSIGRPGGGESWNYLLNQCVVIAGYLGKAFWPHPLVLDYGFPETLALADVWPFALLLGLLLGGTAIAIRHRPALGFCGAWFSVILAPTSSIVPILNEIGAERRVYVSLAALVCLIVYALFRIAPRWPSMVITGAVVMALGTVTYVRNGDHEKPVVLWQTVVDAVPQNARAHTYLGLAVAEQGSYGEAIRHYSRALRLKPDFVDAHNNLGIALDMEGDYAQAMEHYRAALTLQPHRVETLNNYGNVQLKSGMLNDVEESYRRALALDPQDADAHNNLGIALGMQSQPDSAVVHFRLALQFRPGFAEARNNLKSTLDSGRH